MRYSKTSAIQTDFSPVGAGILAFLGGLLTTVGGVATIAAVSVLFILLLPWLMSSELAVVIAWSAILGGLGQNLTSTFGLAIFAVPLLAILWVLNCHARGDSTVGHTSPMVLMMALFTTLYLVSTFIFAPSGAVHVFLGGCVSLFGIYWVVRGGRPSYIRLQRIMLAFFFGAAGSAAAVILRGDYVISEGARRLTPGGGVNTYAAYLVAAFGIGIPLLQTAKGIYRGLIVSGLAIMGVELLFSASRSALLGLLVILLLSFGLLQPTRYGRKRQPAFVAVLIGIAIAAAISGDAGLELVEGRIDTLFNYRQDFVTNNRAYLWEMALESIEEHPIFGLGAGRFASSNDFYQLKAETGAPSELPPGEPHNMFLGIATDTGLIGVAIMLSILGLGFANLLKPSSKVIPVRNGIFAALVGVLVADQFQPSQLEPTLYLILGLTELVRLVGQRAVLQSAINAKVSAEASPRLA